MTDQTELKSIKAKYKSLSPILDERSKRIWAATEARNSGWGGVTLVHLATGIARNTIRHGISELKNGKLILSKKDRVRRSGGGRKLIVDEHPELLKALEMLVDSGSRGDPQSPLRWTLKSTKRLAIELTNGNYPISDRKVADLLIHLGFSLQANRKTKEGTTHPDRNLQFEYINKVILEFQKIGQPVISVDTKKKELIGDFKNAGREWRKKDNPENVRVHDFVDKKLGKGIPYGVYDLSQNQGWVSVGSDHDTAEFAVATIARWWNKMGQKVYKKANKLLITADSGGSNSSRSRLWKVELARFAKKSGLEITVAHLPPGTSKWNKIEHKMFSFITQNWRGRPLLSHEVMVNLIANTSTSAGLKICSSIDSGEYETGLKISNFELEGINLSKNKFHGDWNYTISP